MTSAYDPEFASAVLKTAAKAFPKQLTIAELKRELSPEPSNQSLYTAIDALEADGFIEAKAMRSGSHNEIQDVAYIRATLQGRHHLTALSQPPTPTSPVFTVTRSTTMVPSVRWESSTGVVNVYEQAASTEPQVDLQVLAAQLEQLRAEFVRWQRRAKTIGSSHCSGTQRKRQKRATAQALLLFFRAWAQVY